MRLDDVFTCWTFKLRRLGAGEGWGEELCLSGVDVIVSLNGVDHFLLLEEKE